MPCYGSRMFEPRAIVLVGLLVAACAPPAPQTAAELRTAIAAYEHGETPETEQQIDALFARLDAEIAVVRAEELAKPMDARGELVARRAALESERRSLQQAYVQARVTRAGVAAKKMLESLSDQLGQRMEDAGRSLRESARDEGAK